jgi:hypothetical protein
MNHFQLSFIYDGSIHCHDFLMDEQTEALLYAAAEADYDTCRRHDLYDFTLYQPAGEAGSLSELIERLCENISIEEKSEDERQGAYEALLGFADKIENAKKNTKESKDALELQFAWDSGFGEENVFTQQFLIPRGMWSQSGSMLINFEALLEGRTSEMSLAEPINEKNLSSIFAVAKDIQQDFIAMGVSLPSIDGALRAFMHSETLEREVKPAKKGLTKGRL